MVSKSWFVCVATVFLLMAGTVLPAVQDEQKKVDINTASQKELETLPGIGPSLASRIIEHREKNGPFKRIEEIMNVPGIAEKKFELLKDRIAVGEPQKKPDGR